MSRTKFNVIWRNMKHRCLKNDHVYYKKYGIKRINLHDEWNEFINFKNDVYEEYLKFSKENPGKTIMFVRKDLSKGFTPSNCEFRVMGLHRSVECIGYAPDGKKYTFINQKQFAEEHNLSRHNINKCLKGERLYHKGWLFQYRGELNDKSS